MNKKFIVGLVIFHIVTSVFAFDVPFNLPWQERNATEFINVVTKFTLANSDGQNKKIRTYGNPQEDEDISVIRYKVGQEVVLRIDMHATMLSKAYEIFDGVRKSERDPDREILVSVTIRNSKNIQVTQTGGMSNVIPERMSDGSTTYTFTIKNNHEIYPSVVFKFVPAVIGRTSIELKYAEDSNIVVNSCNVLQEIEFN